jgi:hypothetical protein
MTSDDTTATMTFDAIVAFVIHFVGLLTSSPVMWREEHHWNFGVLQTVHLFNLVVVTTMLFMTPTLLFERSQVRFELLPLILKLAG